MSNQEMVRNVLIIIVGLMVILLVIQHLLIINHKTSVIINSLQKYFIEQNQKIIEFRTTKEKSTLSKVREFEIKTVNQNYYIVFIKEKPL